MAIKNLDFNGLLVQMTLMSTTKNPDIIAMISFDENWDDEQWKDKQSEVTESVKDW